MLLFVCHAVGQNGRINFDYYTTRNGLPSQYICNCVQDKDGFLWIATAAGVSRFDGTTYKNFNTSDGLGDNEVLDVYQDATGRIWFIPFSGALTYYHKGKIRTQSCANINPVTTHAQASYINVTEDALKNVYLNKEDSKRILKLRTDGRTDSVIDVSGFLEKEEGIGYLYGSDGNRLYCLTTTNRVLAISAKGVSDLTPKCLRDLGSVYRTQSKHTLHDRELLILGTGGLFLLKDTTLRLVIPATKIPFSDYSNVIHIYKDLRKNIWLTHTYSHTLLYRYENGEYQTCMPVFDESGMLYTDSEDNIWHSSLNGLCKTSYTALQNELTFYINENLHSRNVTAIAIDKDSGFWFGYTNGFLSHITRKSVKHFDLNVGRKNTNRVVDIQVDANGNIAAVTDESRSYFVRRIKAGKYSEPALVRKVTGDVCELLFKRVLLDNKGRFYFLGAFLDLPIRFNERSARLAAVKTPIEYCERRFSGIFHSKGGFYMGSLNGLIHVGESKRVNLWKQDRRLKTRIQDFAENRDGVLFLASYNSGVFAIEANRVIAYQPDFNGLNLVCRRLIAKNDTLYIATNSGVAMLAYAHKKFSFMGFLSTPEGLISKDVQDVAFFGNQLFAATSQGISSFEIPQTHTHVSVPPLPVIQSVKVDDEMFDAQPRFELPSKTKLIRISYVAPIMDRPELTMYRYRLDQRDSWQQTNAHFIEFSQMKYGKHVIEIQARKYNSNWSSSTLIMIIIQTPFYYRNWFVFSAALLLIALLFLAIRYQLNRRYKALLLILTQKQAIERERNRIAADIHDDIGAELTNIVILSQILKKSKLQETDRTLNTVQKIETSANEVITKMNEVIWTLNTTSSTLSGLIAYIRNYVYSVVETLPQRVNLIVADEVMTERELTAEFTRNVFLTVKELLRNGIKHAGANTINIDMKLKESFCLMITYTDDGKGFDVEKEGVGNGLKNIRKRIADVEGVLRIYTKKNEGCKIIATFPIK